MGEIARASSEAPEIIDTNTVSCIMEVPDKDTKTRPISDGFRKNNVNYWAFREIRSIIPHL